MSASNQSRTAVLGVGWVNAQAWGGIRRGASVAYAGLSDLRALWRHAPLFAYPVKSIGRFDLASLATCYAVALALRDAGVAYAEGRRQAIGLLGTDAEGALAANRAYFTDYVRNGRTLGRGNLFIYTPPSSPLAEAAIHFGLSGPTLYVGAGATRRADALRIAGQWVEEGACDAAVVVDRDAQAAAGWLLGAGPGLCALDEAAALAQAAANVDDLVSRLTTRVTAGGSR